MHHIKKLNVIDKVTINKSNLVNGIFNDLLYDIFTGKLTDDKLDKFGDAYAKIIKNKEDRSFHKTSKTPFSKWYIKGYFNLAKYMTIIDAIKTGNLYVLNKNLLTPTNKIISINGENVWWVINCNLWNIIIPHSKNKSAN